MARTVLNAKISSAAPYTVPAGKYAIFKAFAQMGNQSIVKIDGTEIAAVNLGGTNANSMAGPLVAAAGNILTTTDSSGPVPVGISGFLYDVV